MTAGEPLLVTLVKLVDRIPHPPQPAKRGRGRPKVYSDRLFLKALVVMLIKHLSKVYELLSVLEQPTAEMRALRLLLTTQDGRYPSRRTFERRLKAMPETLPAQIACPGRELVESIQPWARCGRAAALDSTLLRAQGGVWHKKDRGKGEVPHSAIDTEAHWGKSGWHGWVYGWKLHIACTVAGVWIPLAARLTPANVADSEVASRLIEELPNEARYVLGDLRYNVPEVRPAVRGCGSHLGDPQVRGVPPHGRWGGGTAHLPPVEIEGDRELQRAVQDHLRRPHPSAHEWATQHHPLRIGGGLRLPVGLAVSPPARTTGPAPRAQGLPQGSVSNCDQPSVSADWTRK